jgi:hypothetical protein
MNRTKANRTIKKAFTLSPESVAFLEKTRKKRRVGTVSVVLEQILRDARHEQERASIERAITDYYSSLADSDVEEKEQWGDFALAQYSKDDVPF